ncbi:hypothetical protein C8Q78DRAFT_158812 [Trametes maxima]|nr:hypothetical protein C8Q78DRAFT_158812 [Trametes maxima]
MCRWLTRPLSRHPTVVCARLCITTISHRGSLYAVGSCPCQTFAVHMAALHRPATYPLMCCPPATQNSKSRAPPFTEPPQVAPC